MTRAARAAGIYKRASCHTFHHSFANHLLKRGRDSWPPYATAHAASEARSTPGLMDIRVGAGAATLLLGSETAGERAIDFELD